MRRIRWSRALGALVLTLLWTASAPALAMAMAMAAAPPPHIRPGQPLAEALEALRDQGLQVVFTSRLVTPELSVETVPETRGRSARALLVDLLRPHGLAVREVAGGVLVVVEGPRAATDSAGAAVETFQLSDEIVVRPSRMTLLGEEPASTFSLDRRDIESLPKLGGDLFRAATLLPGVTGNDVSAAFSVHGGRRDEVRVLLDGQELYVPYHLADYDDALSIVPGRMLASADLQTGAYPAFHGDRMSAVLDLDTVVPQAAPRVALGLSVLDATALASGPVAGGQGGWLVSGRRGSLDFAGDAVGDEDPAFWDLFATLDLPAGPTGRWTLRALDAHDELELATEDEDGFERLDTDYRSTYVWLTHTAPVSDRLVAVTRGSWSQVHRQRNGLGAEDDEGSFDVLDRRRLDVLELAQEWDLGLTRNHLLRWGAEGRHYETEIAYRRRLDPALELVAPFSPPRMEALDADVSLESQHLGVWASDRFTRGRFTGEMGLRFDRHTETDDSLWSPRANVAWRFTPELVGRAAWGRYYQSQRPYELAIADGERELQRAELSEHFVIGLEAFLGGSDLSWGPLGLDLARAEVYRREIERPRPRYENLLEPLNVFQEIEPDRVRIAPSRSQAEGVEALLRGRIGDGERVGWWMSYTYARATDRIRELGGREVPRSLDQPHTAVLNVDWKLPRSWRLNTAWRYRSGWPTTPVTVQAVPDPDDPDDPETSEDTEVVATFGDLNSRRLPIYHRLDLRLSRELPVRRGRLIFYLDVQNLYDRENVSGFDPELDDDGLELEPETWPGIFPSLGVRWEF